ncbi:hypothetical protein GSU69_11285 [Rathayibacter festucae]|uniref:Uncharacterized protein n=1 Tax=Rathayibacter festucae TaxID=110937 RepID=A0ABX6H094_9MICO|nr:hypothetical protein [Rathayibacter festucae]QHC63210.1 hypothetical protein GSU69_11285 [Rathayibacter festucae]
MTRRLAPVLASALLGLVLAGCASSPTPASTPDASAAPSAGDLVAAAVDVRFTGDAMRLCPFDGDPGFTMGPSPCEDGLSLTGIAPDDLRSQSAAQGFRPRTEDGVETIPAYVVGRLTGRSFDFVSADGERYVPVGSSTPTAVPTPAPSFATDEEKIAYSDAQPVPQPEGCTAPAGGWRSMAALGLHEAAAYQQAHPRTVLGNAQTFVDHSTQIALLSVAADADPAIVAADLATAYPGALCVLQTDITADDLDRVQVDPVLAAAETVLSSSLWQPSETSGDDPDPVFTVRTTVLTDEAIERAAEYPDGLVELQAWFEPVVDRDAS